MDRTKNRGQLFLGIATFVMALLIALDIYEDSIEGTPWQHLLLEFILFALSLSAFVFVMFQLLKEKQKTRQLETKIDHLAYEKAQLKAELQVQLRGLARIIDSQFFNWGLTHSEQEVGYLLLKGFSLKEISNYRQTSTKTVEAQSQSIYKKSGTSGRSEFAAYFLEDLLPDKKRPPNNPT